MDTAIATTADSGELTLPDIIFPTISAAMQHFAETRSGSPRTSATYKHALTIFGRFLADYTGIDVQSAGTDALTNDLPAEFYSWLANKRDDSGERAYRPMSSALYTAAIRAFLTELSLLDQVPQVHIPRMIDLVKKRVPRSIYPQVDPSSMIPLIVSYYDELPVPGTPQGRLVLRRNQALLYTLYSTAMRISECASLRRSQVVSGADECLITGKGGSSRPVYFTPDARERIAAYLSERAAYHADRQEPDRNPYLFASHGRGANKKKSTPADAPGPAPSGVTRKAAPRPVPLTRAHLWEIVHVAAEARGAPDVHPHVFRHFRASHWLTSGMPLPLVQELLGHRDISLTRKVYARYLGSTAKDAFFSYAPPQPPDRLHDE